MAKRTDEPRTKLEAFLKDNNVKQKELAQWAKLETQQVSLLCSGKQTDMMLSTAKRICQVLGTDLNNLFWEEQAK